MTEEEDTLVDWQCELWTLSMCRCSEVISREGTCYCTDHVSVIDILMHVLFCGPISLITIAADDADACQFEAVNPMNGLQKSISSSSALRSVANLRQLRLP